MARVRKCRICGHVFNDGEDMLVIPCNGTNANGGKQWVCEKHGKMLGYHDDYAKSIIDIIKAKFEETSENILVAPELEFNYYEHTPEVNGIEMEHDQINAYLSYLFGGVVTYDGTVSGELNVPPVRSLRGFRDRLGQAMQVVDMTAPNCGAHVNISIADWQSDYIWDYDKVDNIFHHVATSLSVCNMENEVRSVFGRYFGRYCEFTSSEFVHGSWLNIKSNECCLEFRLAHVESVEQYMRCLDLCKRWALRVNDCLKGDTTITDTVKFMIKDLKKAAKGALAVDNRAYIVGTDRTRNQRLVSKRG